MSWWTCKWEWGEEPKKVNWVFGLVLGLIRGLIGGLVLGLVDLGYMAHRLPKSHRPYQRLWSSFVFEFFKDAALL